MFDVYKEESVELNPFLPSLLGHSKKNKLISFLLSLLLANDPEVRKKTPKEIVSSFDPLKQVSGETCKKLLKSYGNNLPMGVPSKSIGISPRINLSLEEPTLPPPPTTKPNDLKTSKPNQKNQDNPKQTLPADPQKPKASPDPPTEPPSTPKQNLNISADELLFNGFLPEYLSPPPPILEPLDQEISWLYPEENYSVDWDYSMCLGHSANNSWVRGLLLRAFKESLLPSQAELVKTELLSNPRLASSCGVTPKKLPDLVQHNPTIAISVFSSLLASIEITEYCDALIRMDMNLNSMQVINSLISEGLLPPQYIQLYISSSIESCRNVHDKDNQNRMVRLVCVIFQSLVKNKIISGVANGKDFVEIQAFCIEFIKIREAVDLFKLLTGPTN
uniref:CCR4-NOT transcription complex subunit 11 n=1 Tax=Arcella intermedia TaxID=1963864 RepID=A0A6B2L6S6_9EUKA